MENTFQKKFRENQEKFKDFNPNDQALGDNLFGLSHGREDAIVRVIPINSAITVSGATGAENGPAGLLLGSKCIELFSPHYYPDTWAAGMFMEPIDGHVTDLHNEGRKIFEEILNSTLSEQALEYNLTELNRVCDVLNSRIEDWVHSAIIEGNLVAVIGGCHGSIFGSVKAHSKTYTDFSVLTIDAHLDLRDAFEGAKNSHASIMRNILTHIPEVRQLVSVGIRSIGRNEFEFAKEHEDRVTIFYADDMEDELDRVGKEQKSWHEVCSDIVAAIPTRDVYISFDHDGLEVYLCPSTGTPVPGGLSMWQAKTLLTLLSKKKRIIGFDLNEMVPGTQVDRNSAAELFYHMYQCMTHSHNIFPLVKTHFPVEQ